MIDFPTHIQIQTTTACGAKCSICPHPVESPLWENGKISDELFASILEQLKGRNIEYLSPYLMADPLADKKIFERIAMIREILPQTTIEMSVTGQLLLKKNLAPLLSTPLSELRISSHGLSVEEYQKTMPGVDFDRAIVNINAFIEAWKKAKPYHLSIVTLWGLWPRRREAEIEAYWAEKEIELSKWRVVSRSDQVDLTVFGDGSPDPTVWTREGQEAPYMCRQERDQKWLHILSDGRVVLCCMDYKQSHVIGDLRQNSIEEIWHGDQMNAYREAIRSGEGELADMCRKCEWHVSQTVHDQEMTRRAAS